jgi:pimeloyl-ACP methyl ester carboxylesterase/class 3 adenylate cyclase
MARMPPEVRYARSDGLRIAYQVVGDGPIDVVYTSGASSHLDLIWENPHWARHWNRLAEFSRLIVFDKRGTGLSDRPDHLSTLEERIDDIRTVMDAAGSSQASLIGVSEGGPMALLFAATHPQRVRSLVVHGAKARYAWAPDWPWGLTDAQLEEVLARNNAADWITDYSQARGRRWIGPELRDDAALIEWLGRFWRSGGSPAAREALTRMNHVIDVRAVLPAIRVPVLITVREDDPVCPVAASELMASLIPDARLVVFPGQGHLLFGILEEWTALVEEFVTGRVGAASHDRLLATLVSMDIVGSTDLIGRIGDAAWRDLLDRHYTLVARELAVYGGIEVDRAGDGFLARFDGPGRAIRFAQAVVREDRGIGLTVRAGVHTGEVELAGAGVRGVAVHTVARIAALAKPGEVLLSSTVRDLVAGAGLTLADRGLHELKGIPEQRQLYAVA